MPCACLVSLMWIAIHVRDTRHAQGIHKAPHSHQGGRRAAERPCGSRCSISGWEPEAYDVCPCHGGLLTGEEVPERAAIERKVKLADDREFGFILGVCSFRHLFRPKQRGTRPSPLSAGDSAL